MDRFSNDELEGLRVSEAIRQGVLAERDEQTALAHLEGRDHLRRPRSTERRRSIPGGQVTMEDMVLVSRRGQRVQRDINEDYLRVSRECDELKQAILAYDDGLFRGAPEEEQMALHEAMLRLAGRYAQSSPQPVSANYLSPSARADIDACDEFD